MAKKHKFIGRVVSLLTLTFIVSQVFSPVFLGYASARKPDSNLNPWTVYKNEYRSRAAAMALKTCFSGVASSISIAEYADDLYNGALEATPDDLSFNTGSAVGILSADSSYGPVWGTDYYVDCNTESDLGALAAMVGYSDLRDMVNDVWQKPSAGGVRCNDDGTINSDGGYICPKNGSLETHLIAKAKSKGLLGYDDDIALSQQAIFWFWNYVFTTPDGPKNGCGGSFYTEDTGKGKASDKADNPALISHLTDARRYARWNPEQNKLYVDRTYAIWDTENSPTGTASREVRVPDGAGGLDKPYGTSNSGSAPGCDKIAFLAGNNSAAKLVEADYKQYCKTECAAADTDSTGDTSDDSVGGGSVDSDVCEAKGWSLSWVACPILNGINSFLTFVRDKLVDLLRIQDSQILVRDPNCSGKQCGIYTIWVQFKTLANIFFVIIALVIILSQALSIEIVSAYTAKKALPRLLIAVIAVQFSWLICTYMVQLTNILGADIEGIMYAPFGGSANLKVGLSDSTAGVAALLSGATAVGIVIAGAFAVFLPLFLAALLAVFTAFFVLVARQALLLLLIVTAPLAFTAFVLPQTQKLAKLWWDFFSKGLMMYPLIIMLIAMGRIFGSTIAQGNELGAASDAPSFFYSVIGFIAVYAPYFLIPATFKFAGGLIGNLGGFVNDKSRGLVDRARKNRDAKVAQNFAKFKQGQRFDEAGVMGRTFGRSLNTVGRGYGTGMAGRYGLDSSRREMAMGNQVRQAAADKMKDPTFMANQHDKDMLRAATYENEQAAVAGLTAHYQSAKGGGLSADEARAKAEKAAASVRSTIGFSQASQYAAAQQMVLNKTDVEDAQDARQIFARVGRGSQNIEDTMRGFNNAYSKTVGRNDISDISTDDISLGRAEQGMSSFRSDTSDQLMDDIRTGGVEGAGAKATRAAHIRGYATGDTTSVVRGNERNVKNITSAFAEEYEEGQHTQDQSKMDGARKVLVELERAKDYSTGKNEGYIDAAGETFDQIDTDTVGRAGMAGAGPAARAEQAKQSANKNARGRDFGDPRKPGGPNDVYTPPPDQNFS